MACQTIAMSPSSFDTLKARNGLTSAISDCFNKCSNAQVCNQGEQPRNLPLEILKSIVKAPISFLVFKYNKLQSICLPRKLVATLGMPVHFVNVHKEVRKTMKPLEVG